MNERIRLRQICLAVDRLEPAIDRLIDLLQLQVCHGKGDLSRYGVPYHAPPPYQAAFFAKHGITGALLPIGDTFLELIAPLKDDSAVARYLQRRGPGGYMVINEVASTQPYLERAAQQGVRIAGSADYPTYHEVQLDPRDVGGAILSFSMQREGHPFDGGWFPAGPDWHQRAAPGWNGITRAVLSVKDPAAVAARWSALIGRPAEETGRGQAIRLDNATLEFVAGGEGGDRLAEIGVAGSAFAPALARAAAQQGSTEGEAIVACGLRFREAASCT